MIRVSAVCLWHTNGKATIFLGLLQNSEFLRNLFEMQIYFTSLHETDYVEHGVPWQICATLPKSYNHKTAMLDLLHRLGGFLWNCSNFQHWLAWLCHRNVYVVVGSLFLWENMALWWLEIRGMHQEWLVFLIYSRNDDNVWTTWKWKRVIA